MKKTLGIIMAIALALSCAVPAAAESTGKTLYNNLQDNMPRASGLTEQAPPPPAENETLTPEDEQKQAEYWSWRNEELKDHRDGLMRVVFKDKCPNFDLPKDPFSGDYKETKGEDGSVTKEYANGSLETTWPDGSSFGADGAGNLYFGNPEVWQTVITPDGLQGTLTEDGAIHVEGKDGGKGQIWEDGTSTWITPGGVAIDYDEDGERTAIGFVGGEKMALENGMFPQGKGELAGPDGAKLAWSNGVTPKGDNRYSFEVTDKNGNSGRANYDPSTERSKEAVNIPGVGLRIHLKSWTRMEATGLDGTNFTMKISNQDSNKQEYTYTTPSGFSVYDSTSDTLCERRYTNPDGSHREIQVHPGVMLISDTDADGQRTEGEMVLLANGNYFGRFQDGTTLTITPDGVNTAEKPDGTHIVYSTNDESMEYNGADGQTFRRDATGKTVAAHIKRADGSVIDLVDGEWSYTDAKGEEVAVWELDENGDMKIIRTNGGDFTFDENGFPYLNGKPIMTEQKPTIEPKSTPEETPGSASEPADIQDGVASVDELAGAHDDGTAADIQDGAPTFDELTGAYDDGTCTITSVFISDSLRSELASDDYGEEGEEYNEYGCDINSILLSMEEMIGTAMDLPFTVEKNGENSGTLSCEGGFFFIRYDPESGLLGCTFGGTTETDEIDDEMDALGITVIGDLCAAYNADKSRISISGELKTTCGLYGEDDFYYIYRLEGSKQLVK